MQTLILLTELKQQTDAYINFLDKELFYEAHEALEVLWFPKRFEKTHPEVRLLRAYINAAVSFELVKRGRPKSGLKPWGFYQKNISYFCDMPKEHQLFYQKIDDKIQNIRIKLQCFSETV